MPGVYFIPRQVSSQNESEGYKWVNLEPEIISLHLKEVELCIKQLIASNEQLLQAFEEVLLLLVVVII